MMEHDETVCPGCGEQAAGHQFCPSCGLQIGSFRAAATPATAHLTEPEPEPEPREASPDLPHLSPSSPWSTPFTAHVSDEVDNDAPDETEDPTPAELDAVDRTPELVDSGREPAPLAFPDPFAAPAIEPDDAEDEPAGETAETPELEVVADEGPAPVAHAVPAYESNAIYTRGSSDRRAAVACIAALLFVLVILMNRGVRR